MEYLIRTNLQLEGNVRYKTFVEKFNRIAKKDVGFEVMCQDVINLLLTQPSFRYLKPDKESNVRIVIETANPEFCELMEEHRRKYSEVPSLGGEWIHHSIGSVDYYIKVQRSTVADKVPDCHEVYLSSVNREYLECAARRAKGAKGFNTIISNMINPFFAKNVYLVVSTSEERGELVGILKEKGFNKLRSKSKFPSIVSLIVIAEDTDFATPDYETPDSTTVECATASPPSEASVSAFTEDNTYYMSFCGPFIHKEPVKSIYREAVSLVSFKKIAATAFVQALSLGTETLFPISHGVRRGTATLMLSCAPPELLDVLVRSPECRLHNSLVEINLHKDRKLRIGFTDEKSITQTVHLYLSEKQTAELVKLPQSYAELAPIFRTVCGSLCATNTVLHLEHNKETEELASFLNSNTESHFVELFPGVATHISVVLCGDTTPEALEAPEQPLIEHAFKFDYRGVVTPYASVPTRVQFVHTTETKTAVAAIKKSVFNPINATYRVLLIEGEAGTGKSLFVQYLASVLELPYYIQTTGAGATEESLIGRYTSKDGKIEYVESEFTTCFRNGGVCEIAELNSISDPGIALCLANALVPRGVITLQTGERVNRNRFSYFVITGNPGYSGTSEINEAIVDRANICVQMPPPDELRMKEIIRKSVAVREKIIETVVQTVWRINENITQLGLRSAVSPRTAISLACALESGIPVKEAIRLFLINKITVDAQSRKEVSAFISEQTHLGVAS